MIEHSVTEGTQVMAYLTSLTNLVSEVSEHIFMLFDIFALLSTSLFLFNRSIVRSFNLVEQDKLSNEKTAYKGDDVIRRTVLKIWYFLTTFFTMLKHKAAYF